MNGEELVFTKAEGPAEFELLQEPRRFLVARWLLDDREIVKVTEVELVTETES